MDTYLAIASKRDERRYADRPVAAELVARILDAGRVAGSAMNRQPWQFLVVEDRARVERLAETVYAPQNVLGAALVIAVVMRGTAAFDAGRACQNMMLAAWNEGVASCPNGLADQERARELLGLADDERVATVLSFGYPSRPRDPASRSAEDWSRRANRKPPQDVVRRR